MPDISILVKPSSSACDLACSYCFYRDVAQNRENAFDGLLDAETAEILVKKALGFAAGGSCSFLFQGGEPTLRGLGWYEAFIGYEKKYALPGTKVFNGIQTNGVRIDDDWARFLSENGFLTGLSLDGNAELHDRNRCFPDGKGSFNRVMKAAAALQKHGAPFNILSVVTGESARRIEKTYRFFRKSGFGYLQFIPCLEPLGAERGASSYALTPPAYGDFLVRLFDLWYADLTKGTYVSIRYFDDLMLMFTGRQPGTCGMTGRCGLQFVVEGNGKVYPCDFYVLDGKELGDVKKDAFSDMIRSENAKTFINESLYVPEDCKTCRWYGLCRNGCKRDRVSANGLFGKNYYCASYRTFFEKRINELMNAARLISRQGASPHP